MYLILDCNVKEIEKIKSDVIDFLDQKEISYNIVDDDNCDKICINFGRQDDKSHLGDCSIIVDSCNKDVYRIHPNEIIYIAIEQRKSVLYLTNDRRIETNYHIDYWKDILNKKTFAQPHYSYIVNLNYVYTATRDFVKLKYNNKQYSVYASARKKMILKKLYLSSEDNAEQKTKLLAFTLGV